MQLTALNQGERLRSPMGRGPVLIGSWCGEFGWYGQQHVRDSLGDNRSRWHYAVILYGGK